MSLMILSACSGSGATVPTEAILDCPATEYVVCRGGTVSRIGNRGRQDPKFCSCEPKD